MSLDRRTFMCGAAAGAITAMCPRLPAIYRFEGVSFVDHAPARDRTGVAVARYAHRAFVAMPDGLYVDDGDGFRLITMTVDDVVRAKAMLEDAEIEDHAQMPIPEASYDRIEADGNDMSGFKRGLTMIPVGDSAGFKTWLEDGVLRRRTITQAEFYRRHET